MKAFRFRLDQALRWRATQLDLEKAAAAAVAQKVNQLHEEIETTRANVNRAAADLRAGTDGAALAVWGAFSDRGARRVRELQKSAKEAEKALAERMAQVLAARRRMMLLEKLKDGERRKWQSEFDRELDAFAAEAHLFRLHAAGRDDAP